MESAPPLEGDPNFKNSKIKDKIKLHLLDLKKETDDIFIGVKNDIENSYKAFEKSIFHYVSDSLGIMNVIFKVDKDANSLKEDMEALQDTVSKDATTELKKIFSVYKNVVDSLKDLFGLLNNLLLIENYLTKEHPTEEFIKDNLNIILKSWVFKKIDFSKFDVSKMLYSENLDEDLQNLVSKNLSKLTKVHIMRNENKLDLKHIKTQSDSKKMLEYFNKNKIDLEKDLVMLRNNRGTLQKIYMSNISDFQSFFPDSPDEASTYPTVTKFEVKKLKLESSPDFQKIVPSCKKLIIKNCPGLYANPIQAFPSNLIRLTLTKNRLINKDVNFILDKICQKGSPLLKSLEYLSLSHNCITFVDFEKFVYQNNSMRNLKEIDFSKNKITKFLFDPTYFNSLKFINLTHNNFSKDYFRALDNGPIIMYLNNNIYLTDKKKRQDYLETLKRKINQADIGFSFLSFSGLFDFSNYKALSELKIKYKIQVIVKRLDLSYCCLDNETLITFLENNKGFLNLQVLNLSCNKINDDFFNLFIERGFHKIFRKLKKVSLSGCHIIGSKFEEIKNFVVENKRLTKLNLTKNPFNKKYSVEQANRERRLTGEGKDIASNGPGQTPEGEPRESMGTLVDLLEFVKVVNQKGEGANSCNERYVRVKFDTKNKKNINSDEEFKIQCK